MDRRLNRRILIGGIAAGVAGLGAGALAIQTWDDDSVPIATPSPFPPTADDVPVFRGNTAHTGQMPGSGPTNAPRVRWEYDLGGHALNGGPAVAGGLVFALSQTGVVHAVDLATGAARWQTNLASPNDERPGGFWPSTPAIAGGRVLVSTMTDLFALDAATGAKLWRYGGDGDWYADSSPTVVDGIVYLHAGDTLRAVDADSGQERWRSNGDPAAASPSVPAIAEGVAYLGMSQSIHAVDLASGRTNWEVSAGQFIHATPAVADGVVYVGSGTAGRTDGLFLALDAESGRQQWVMNFGTAFEASPAVADNILYLVESQVNAAAELVALDLVTLKEHWRTPIGNVIGSPIVAGDLIYPGAELAGDSAVASRLRAFSRADGTERWSIPLGVDSESGIDFRGHQIATDGLLLGIGNAQHATLYALGNP